MRQLLRDLSTVLITAGSLLILDAGLTLVWQEPVSAVYAHFEQNKLSDELSDLETEQLSQIELRALAQFADDRRRIAFLARQLSRSARPGQAIGRIRIPKIGAKFVVVQGTDTNSLQKGPGHYEDTALPGARGTTAFAGHRTTYLAPFRKINQLKKGNTIVLQMPYATVTYSVIRTRIVLPSDVGVLKRRSYDQLVLTACHPLYSAARRIVVFARFVDEQPRGAARRSAWEQIKRRGELAAVGSSNAPELSPSSP